ncbi:hypothetical protein LG943_26745 [Streptomonospora sp. S1-112]|uniref:Uncharacterized protein n=1 Tax=Streptomonospora mangrovi TaxID=2883123 RepID=A0A9X3P112_9ACTN|nr:hypothetical protein [Streptomonospora mangrovi]MDA0567891.1 hypothetical protein [Streptomonospora mangrovi]
MSNHARGPSASLTFSREDDHAFTLHLAPGIHVEVPLRAEDDPQAWLAALSRCADIAQHCDRRRAARHATRD